MLLMAAPSITKRKLKKTLPKTYDFNTALTELDIDSEFPEELLKYFNICDKRDSKICFWAIEDNNMMLEILKSDPNIHLRAFLYLKKIKYLQMDVKKIKQINHDRITKINKLKVINNALSHKLNVITHKLKNIENTQLADINIPYTKIFAEPFLMQEMEDHYNEFKSRELETIIDTGKHIMANGALHKIQKTMLGFLNADGGTLYIGVDDDGLATGIYFESRQHLDSFLKQIDNTMACTIPLMYERFHEYKFWKVKNCIIIVVIIYPQIGTKQMVVLNGSDRLFIRRNTTTLQYSKQDYDDGYCHTE